SRTTTAVQVRAIGGCPSRRAPKGIEYVDVVQLGIRQPCVQVAPVVYALGGIDLGPIHMVIPQASASEGDDWPGLSRYDPGVHVHAEKGRRHGSLGQSLRTEEGISKRENDEPQNERARKITTIKHTFLAAIIKLHG